MTIQSTLGALVDAEPTLRRVAGLKFTDMKARYHVGKLLGLMAAEAREFNRLRDDLIQEFGEKREPTEQECRLRGPAPLYEIRPDRFEAYAAKVKELGSTAVEISWGPITAAMMESCPDALPSDLPGLGPFFTFESA